MCQLKTDKLVTLLVQKTLLYPEADIDLNDEPSESTDNLETGIMNTKLKEIMRNHPKHFN